MNIIANIKRANRRARKTLLPVSRIIPTVQGTLLDNKVTAYWFTGFVNFGDLLTPLILKDYDFTPVNYPIARAQVLSTGSILQIAPQNYSGHIIGSGLISDTARPFNNAKIWAVRGKLTRERINANEDTVLGDPGLLSATLLKERQERQYELGIIAHYADKDDPRIAKLKKRYNKEILLIDVERKPASVFKDIDKCNCILSSSLHGIIVADSLNIPNVWIHLSNNVEGKGFKFNDYYSAFNISRDPQTLTGNEKLSQLLNFTKKPPEAVENVKESLSNTFRNFSDHFNSN